MKLLVIMLCLLSEYFLIHSISYKRFFWFEYYFSNVKEFLDKRAIAYNSGMLLAFIVLPIILITSLVYYSVHSLFFGLIGLLINIAIFFYCLGPQNPFYPNIASNTENSNEMNSGIYLAVANNELFAVVFWYIVGGPIAALIFRLISLTQKISQLEPLSRDITEVLEWIPARITVLLYLLVGNFQVAFKRFVSFALSRPHLNHQMLSECGLLAACNKDEEISMPIAEQLVEHAVVVMLVLIALFTMAAWL